MSGGQWYSFLADAVLVVHTLVVIFIVGGLILVLVGYYRNWRWVRNPWFRLLHIGVMAVIVVQSWLGAVCPLTVWEVRLQQLAGKQAYGSDFIRYWLRKLIFYQADAWVFVLVYTLFGLLVVLALILAPPVFRRDDRRRH